MIPPRRPRQTEAIGFESTWRRHHVRRWRPGSWQRGLFCKLDQSIDASHGLEAEDWKNWEMKLKRRTSVGAKQIMLS